MYTFLLVLLSIVVALGMPSLLTPSIILFFIYWLFILQGHKNIKQIFYHPVGLSLVLYFFLNLIGLIYSNSITSGLKIVERNLSFLILPLLLFSSPPLLKEQIKKCIAAFLITLLAILSFSIIVHFINYHSSGDLIIQVDTNRINRFFSYALTSYIPNWHPIYVANFLVFSGLSFIWLNRPNKNNAALLLTITIYLVVLLILLRSLTSIIVLSCFLLLFILKSSSLKKSIIFSLVILISFTALIQFSPTFEEKISKVVYGNLIPTDTKYERNSLTLRLAKWQSSWELIKRNPLIGVGTGDYQDEITKIYQQLGYHYLYKRQMNAHNQFLQTTGSFGFMGLIILLLIFFSPMGFKQLEFIHLLFLLTIVVFSMSEVILGRFQGVLFFVFFQIILSHQNKNDKKELL